MENMRIIWRKFHIEARIGSGKDSWKIVELSVGRFVNPTNNCTGVMIALFDIRIHIGIDD